MKRFAAYVLSVVALSACAQYETFDEMARKMGSDKVPLIQPKEIPQTAILVDNREPEEFAVSHIPGAVSLAHFESEMLDTLDKNRPVVVYCSVGYRSGKYAEDLSNKGFKNVSNLYGGIFHWNNEGMQIVNEGGPTDSIHTYNKRWSQWVTRGIKTW